MQTSEVEAMSTSCGTTLVYVYEKIVIDATNLFLPQKLSIRELGSSGIKLSSLTSNIYKLSE